MTLISNSGGARSAAIEAIRKAREGDFERTDELLKESAEALKAAHAIHFKMLRDDMAGKSRLEFSVLLTHAQDHLMSAQTVLELSRELIELRREAPEYQTERR